MNEKRKTIKALGLCSGGLDSMLAAVILREQGIEVRWICFETPFFSAEKAKLAASQLDVPLTVLNITATYMKMLKNPKLKLGKNMNPCMDCHALMFRLAGEVMSEQGCDFLFSGEVLGQRPMSQTKPSLRYVEKNSGFDGHILRPLSAKLLPETPMEQKGWVDRNALFDLSGRSRKPQIALAQTYHIKTYPAPAGGCLLTDKGYSKRLRDVLEHQESVTEADLLLLKYGRHFRLKNNAKIVVGRTKSDNDEILRLSQTSKDVVFKMKHLPGPIVLIPNGIGSGNETVFLAAAMCAGYSKAEKDVPAEVDVCEGKKRRTIQVLPIEPGAFKSLMV